MKAWVEGAWRAVLLDQPADPMAAMAAKCREKSAANKKQQAATPPLPAASGALITAMPEQPMCGRWLTQPVKLNPVTGKMEEYHSEALKDDLVEEAADGVEALALGDDDY